MTEQQIRDWAGIALVFVGILMFGVLLGYSTCRISHTHLRSCEDGSTRCMQ